MSEVQKNVDRLQLGDKYMIEQGDEIILKINELKKAKEQSKSKYEQEQLGYEILTLARRFNNTELDKMKTRAENELNALKKEGREGGELGQLLNKFLGETDALKSALESARKAEASATKEKWYKIFAPQESMVREVVGEETKKEVKGKIEEKGKIVAKEEPKQDLKAKEDLNKAKQEVLKLLKDGVFVDDEAGYNKFAAHAERGGVKMPKWSTLPSELINNKDETKALTMSFEGDSVNVYFGIVEGNKGNLYIRRYGVIEDGKFEKNSSIFSHDLIENNKYASKISAVEAPKPAEPAKPVEAPKPAEPAKPVEAPKPAEPAKPVEPTKREAVAVKSVESPEAKNMREAIAYNSKYSANDIKKVEGMLIHEEGKGELTGKSDKSLYERVKAFQEKKGFTGKSLDGKIGPKTLEAMTLRLHKDGTIGYERGANQADIRKVDQEFESKQKPIETSKVEAKVDKKQKSPITGVDKSLTPAEVAAKIKTEKKASVSSNPVGSADKTEKKAEKANVTMKVRGLELSPANEEQKDVLKTLQKIDEEVAKMPTTTINERQDKAQKEKELFVNAGIDSVQRKTENGKIVSLEILYKDKTLSIPNKLEK